LESFDEHMRRKTYQLVVRAALIEGGLLGIAVIWIYLRDIPWQSALSPTLAHCCTGIGAGLFLLTVNYLVIVYGSRYCSFFRMLKNLIEQDISPLFKNIHIWGIGLIAIFSGVSEEIFFRGVLQSQIGLFLSSIIFGCVHIWKATAILYGIYAAIIGLYFGVLYTLTGNLWVPVIAHITNNFVAILYYMQTTAPQSEQLIVSEEV
jgi:membrane protease YdiL (CAAX protease family)